MSWWSLHIRTAPWQLLGVLSTLEVDDRDAGEHGGVLEVFSPYNRFCYDSSVHQLWNHDELKYNMCNINLF